VHFVCPDAEPQYRELVEGLADARLRAAGHTFEFFDSVPGDDAELADRIAAADGILLLFSLPAAVLERSERLRVVSWSGTGVARFVDLEAAARAGVSTRSASPWRWPAASPPATAWCAQANGASSRASS
jgi:phosphoglycerate dehydrogenase-like enzyme